MIKLWTELKIYKREDHIIESDAVTPHNISDYIEKYELTLTVKMTFCYYPFALLTNYCIKRYINKSDLTMFSSTQRRKFIIESSSSKKKHIFLTENSKVAKYLCKLCSAQHKFDREMRSRQLTQSLASGQTHTLLYSSFTVSADDNNRSCACVCRGGEHRAVLHEQVLWGHGNPHRSKDQTTERLTRTHRVRTNCTHHSVWCYNSSTLYSNSIWSVFLLF